ncbi:hypothetical protein [Desulfosoma caldarium]|uniref:Uncharacterized protein n=1 Tax=Desulfosoma caldarium TaxID=610254 RepID=A0A3N1UM64_9BACT|nr:hypothetical protein [Desulfosoma caldarium]ROQ89810.1 hypothetical protein EDC27_2922 [Desulfosoma caldarium]
MVGVMDAILGFIDPPAQCSPDRVHSLASCRSNGRNPLGQLSPGRFNLRPYLHAQRIRAAASIRQVSVGVFQLAVEVNRPSFNRACLRLEVF